MLFCHVLSKKAKQLSTSKQQDVMLPNFTWTEYLLTVAALATVYYVIVGVAFYRQELKSFFSSQNKLWQRAEKPPPSSY
jgi:hypothetical protein